MLTKKQRFECYKGVLSLYEKDYQNMKDGGYGRRLGMCIELFEYAKQNGMGGIDYSETLWPELLPFKPKKTYSSGSWFNYDERGTEKRIDILNKAIVNCNV